jgi:hypothetical protein
MVVMDCLTTVIGKVYCGTSELNPLIAGLVNNNLPLFIFIKLSVSFGVGLMLVWAERSLQKNKDSDEKSYKVAKKALNIAYAGIITFLFIVVFNNFFVIFASMNA